MSTGNLCQQVIIGGVRLFPKYDLRDLRILKDPSRGPREQNYFQNNTEMVCDFYTLVCSQAYKGGDFWGKTCDDIITKGTFDYIRLCFKVSDVNF